LDWFIGRKDLEGTKRVCRKGGAYNVVIPNSHGICSHVLIITAEQLTKFVAGFSPQRPRYFPVRNIWWTDVQENNVFSEYFGNRSYIIPQMLIRISIAGWRTDALDATDPIGTSLRTKKLKGTTLFCRNNSSNNNNNNNCWWWWWLCWW
jgi:hypothetical protein